MVALFTLTCTIATFLDKFLGSLYRVTQKKYGMYQRTAVGIRKTYIGAKLN